MAENTLIEWADHTHNPWFGCHKVSSACDFCYAEEEADKRYHKAESTRKEPFKWQRQAAHFALLHGRRQRVF